MTIQRKIMRATVKQIYNEISDLNPKTSTISSMGAYISKEREMLSDEAHKRIIRYLPEGSLARNIAMSNRGFYSEKQLWVIAYELVKNDEYCEKTGKEIAEFEKSIASDKAKKSAKKMKKTELKKPMEELKKANDGLSGSIKHVVFGEGEVIGEDDNTITINFKDFGERRLMKAFTKLERI